MQFFLSGCVILFSFHERLRKSCRDCRTQLLAESLFLFFFPVAFYICCSPEIWVLDCREVKYYTLSLPASFPGGVKTCSCSKVRTLQGSRVWLAVLFLH